MMMMKECCGFFSAFLEQRIVNINVDHLLVDGKNDTWSIMALPTLFLFLVDMWIYVGRSRG
jgi:hypothetical protein